MMEPLREWRLMNSIRAEITLYLIVKYGSDAESFAPEDEVFLAALDNARGRMQQAERLLTEEDWEYMPDGKYIQYTYEWPVGGA